MMKKTELTESVRALADLFVKEIVKEIHETKGRGDLSDRLKFKEGKNGNGNH